MSSKGGPWADHNAHAAANTPSSVAGFQTTLLPLYGTQHSAILTVRASAFGARHRLHPSKGAPGAPEMNQKVWREKNETEEKISHQEEPYKILYKF